MMVETPIVTASTRAIPSLNRGRIWAWVLALDSFEVLVPQRVAGAAELDHGDRGERDVDLTFTEPHDDVVAVPAADEHGRCATRELDVLSRAVEQVLIEVLVEVAQLLRRWRARIELRASLTQTWIVDLFGEHIVEEQYAPDREREEVHVGVQATLGVWVLPFLPLVGAVV